MNIPEKIEVIREILSSVAEDLDNPSHAELMDAREQLRLIVEELQPKKSAPVFLKILEIGAQVRVLEEQHKGKQGVVTSMSLSGTHCLVCIANHYYFIRSEDLEVIQP